ncbi:MAG: DUF6493 family protein [Acidimicrobiales bacterium]|nr:DUF6493 family protein [Acidimicrobiales bacterium]
MARGDDDAIVEMFRDRKEKERRDVGPELSRLQREYLGYGRRVPHEYGDTACAAVFASCTLTEIKHLNVEHTFGTFCNETTLAVLVDRRPAWVTKWAEWALEREARPSGRADGLWVLVRNLIRAGVCEPLDSDAYILGMIFGIGSPRYHIRSRVHGVHSLGIPRDEEAIEKYRDANRSWSVLGSFLDDPSLLDHEIWRIFEVPGRPSRQLSASSADSRDGWIDAFVTLSAEGRISRQRVLESTLDALARDVTQHQSKWFVALWTALGATRDEGASNQERLLHLLDRSVPAVVQFALRELGQLQKEGRLDAEAFISEIEGPLLTMPVATAKAGLRMLDRVGKAHPELRSDALLATTSALLHDHSKVQDSAIQILAKRRGPIDPDLESAIDANSDALTTQQRSQLIVE